VFTDKFGHPLAAGDAIRFPYGGDMHTATITELETQLGVAVVHAGVITTVPAGLVEKLADAPPEPDPKEATQPTTSARRGKPTKTAPRRRSAQ
jgi:hypothetical protein